MKVDSGTKFAIYGAQAQGKEILKILNMSGLKTVAFIDRKADEIQRRQGVIVYHPNYILKLLRKYRKLVVIISVSNVFAHMDIAEELLRAGVQYIVCKNVYKQSNNAKIINDLYDKLTDPRTDGLNKEIEIPLFKESICEEKQSIDQCISGSITCQVPVELLFSMTKDYYLEYPEIKDEKLINISTDRSILYYFIQKDLYQFWENGIGDNNYDYDQCLQLYLYQRRCMIGDLHADEKEERKHIQDRYNIYQNMLNLYNSNVSFFYDNPARVVWNKNGYFNIQDGNNRVAFLLAKGWKAIPCMMSFVDYKKWVNEDSIAKVDSCIMAGDKWEYPILHPNYFKKICFSTPHAQNKLKKICEWLYVNKIETRGLRILDIACRNGYWGQCLARMGAIVTAVEEDNKYLQLCKAINDLSYNGDIKVYSAFEAMKFPEIDIAIIPFWAQYMLKEVADAAPKYIIMDVRDIKKMEYVDAVYEVFEIQSLCRLIYDGEVIDTVILMRK